MFRLWILLAIGIASLGLSGDEKIISVSKPVKPQMRRKSPDRKVTPYRNHRKPAGSRMVPHHRTPTMKGKK